MDASWATFVKDLGEISVVAIASLGSSYGILAAALAAIGGIKKCQLQNKPIPGVLIVYIAAPVSQTIYGLILLLQLIPAMDKSPFLGLFGVMAGLGLAISAYGQGRIGAAAADAACETGKGDPKYIIALGIIETVALFVMVFTILALGNIPAPVK